MRVHGVPKAIALLWKDLPRVDGRNRWIAAIIGFLFGGLGLGLYFWSWKDFLYPILVLVLLLIGFDFILPVVGAAPAWFVGGIFAAGWGFARVSNS
jgi:hypothetical protein